MEFEEPVLLVGETGTGKTSVCQLVAAKRGQRLHILNCNQHTETSDFLGGFRPNRCGHGGVESGAAVCTMRRQSMCAVDCSCAVQIRIRFWTWRDAEVHVH